VQSFTLLYRPHPSTNHKAARFGPRAVAALAAAALCAGCGTFPNATPRPEVSVGSGGGNNVYTVNGKTISHATNTSMLPLELSFDGVRNQLVAMHAVYSQQRQALRVEGDFLRNTQFLGVLATTWGIATDKTKLRNQGAATAGLSSVFSDQYAVTVQARNYALAATAIECVFNQVSRLEASFWTETFHNGSTKLTREDFLHAYADDARAGAVHDTLDDLFPAIHRTVLRIDEKLQSLQASALPAMVSPAEIQQTVNQNIESQQRNQQAIQTLTGIDPKAVAAARAAALKATLNAPKAQGGHGLTGTELDSTLANHPEMRKMDRNAPLVQAFESYLDSGRIALALDLPAELNTCVATMGQ